MKKKAVIPRTLANQDVDQALTYYLEQQAEAAALGFIDALEHAYRQIGHYPESGSPRYAHELDLPGLRSCPVKGYPYMVFYVDSTTHFDVWRVLRDVPKWLQNTPVDS